MTKETKETFETFETKANVNFARSNIGIFRKKSAKVIFFFIFLTR